MATVQIPYKFQPRPHQLRVLQSQKRFKIIVWHRRSGKSKLAWNEIIRRAVMEKGTYHYVCPTYRMAKQIIWNDPSMMEHLPAEIIAKKNDSELIVILKNGSMIWLLGADDPQRLRGANPIGIIFDEFAEMKENVWSEIYRPILFENKGWAWFVGTPRGQNHFWKLYQQAIDNPEYDVFQLPASQNPLVDQEELKKEKDSMPLAFYEQEYEVKWLEGASQFFRRIDENIFKEDLSSFSPEEGKIYQIGCDLAKTQDFTVLTALDRHSLQVVAIERFNQIDWNFQKAKIEAFYRKWNCGRVYLDATGIGDVVFDDLQRQGINVEPYKFTEQSRAELLKNLAILLEQDKIKIPNYDILINELKAFRYELKDRGKVRIQVPEGIHDDCVMSLALASWGVYQPLPLPKEDEFENVITPIISQY